MKHLKLTFLLTVLMSMVGVNAFAGDDVYDHSSGLFFSINRKAYTAAVKAASSSHYMGSRTIPAEIEYAGNKYKVTAIGFGAFRDCGQLISVTIPNSITSIDEAAFQNCI